MTNEFKILWFEDDTTWFTMESKKVTRYLHDRYNLVMNTLRETGANFNPDVLKTDNAYDLIIMDYKLAAGNTGERMIELIRDNSVLTDILLYSSQYKDMTDALLQKSPLIDGVYFADRKNELFELKLFGVIHKIVRRSEDIVNLRGFFLDNTSDFEIRIKELLKLSWDKLPEHHDSMESTMKTILDNILKHDNKLVEELQNNESIFVAANSHKYALSIRYRLEILANIIQILADKGKFNLSDEHTDLDKFDTKYTNEISVYRNALGHKKFSDTSIQIKGKIVQIDETLHNYLRGNINKYDTLIKQIEECIESL